MIFVVASSAIITIDRCPQDSDSLPLMLRPLLFSPAAVWLVRALQGAGVERFLLLTHPDQASEAAACFPEGTQVCSLDAPELKDTVRSFAAGCPGEVISITRPVWLGFAGAGVLTGLGQLPQPEEDFYGICRLSSQVLASYETPADLEQGDPFAPALDDAPLAFPLEEPEALAYVQDLARLDYNDRLVRQGVRMLDAASVYIDPTVTLGRGTVLLPNVILRGDTHIGVDCEIGPNTMIRDCTLGDGCVANSSQLNEAVFGKNVNIGPFAYVRPGTRVADGCKVGDFVEVKNAVIGQGTKLPHLIYVGDSDVGEHCNFGCGSITCNYDGNHKYRTTVGDNVFIGCNTNLVAPVTVEDGAFTAAGSTITSTVPADALAVARARQVHKEGWAKRHREQK